MVDWTMRVAGAVAACAVCFAPQILAAEGGDRPRQVAIVLYDGVELLDWAGPGEVFEAAAGFAAYRGRPAFEVWTVASSADPITSQGFARIIPRHDFATAPLPDVVVVPGGSTAALTSDPSFGQWLEKLREGDSTIILTVCTGAVPLAEAGMLDGLEVTTWYGAVDRLAARAPDADVTHGRRFVDNGSIITTAGVSAGIDGALHLVARLHGRAVADRTAQYMEYRWTPEPYLAREYAVLDPTRDAEGRRSQLAEMAMLSGDHEEALHLLAGLDDPWSAEIAGRSHLALGQHDEAAAAFTRAAEAPALTPGASYNAACALALSGQPETALDRLEAAVEAGFSNLGWIAADPDLESLRSNPRFQSLVGGDDG